MNNPSNPILIYNAVNGETTIGGSPVPTPDIEHERFIFGNRWYRWDAFGSPTFGNPGIWTARPGGPNAHPWSAHNIPKVTAEFADTFTNLEPECTGGGCDFVSRRFGSGALGCVFDTEGEGRTPELYESCEVAFYLDGRRCEGFGVNFPTTSEGIAFLAGVNDWNPKPAEPEEEEKDSARLLVDRIDEARWEHPGFGAIPVGDFTLAFSEECGEWRMSLLASDGDTISPVYHDEDRLGPADVDNLDGLEMIVRDVASNLRSLLAGHTVSL